MSSRGLDLRGPRKRRLPVLNVTSLIDVLFLLLIFFMVSSTFIENPAIELDLPEAAAAESARRDSLTLSIVAGGELYLDGEEIRMEDLSARLETASEENPGFTLILEADRAVGYGRVIEAIDVARQVGIKRISAFTALPGETGSEGARD